MKKKLFTFLTLFIFIAFSFSPTGCAKGGTAKATIIVSSQEYVLIKVEETSKNATVKNALDSLVGQDFSYELNGTLINKVNGVSNAADYSYCWMLYTTDTKYSTSQWGVVELQNMTFYSANFGVKDQPATAGEFYLLKYVAF